MPKYIIRHVSTGKLAAGGDEFEYIQLAETWIDEFCTDLEAEELEIEELDAE